MHEVILSTPDLASGLASTSTSTATPRSRHATPLSAQFVGGEEWNNDDGGETNDGGEYNNNREHNNSVAETNNDSSSFLAPRPSARLDGTGNDQEE